MTVSSVARLQASQKSSMTLMFAMSLCFAVAFTRVSPAIAQEAKPEKVEASSSNVDERYFRKKLELAMHDLQTALQANRQLPNLNSKLLVSRLRNQVAYATMLVQQAGKPSDHDLHQSHLQAVEDDVSLADEQLAHAKKLGGYLRADQVKRIELSAELARLALERAQQPKITADPIQHMQWQIDRLRSELLSLQVEFERTRSSR